MISAATVRPSVDLRLEPSPASTTSPKVTRSPALPSSFSTTILSPGATRYCLPPVRTTANIGSSLLELEIPVSRARVSAKSVGQAWEGEAPMAAALRCQPGQPRPTGVASRQQPQVTLMTQRHKCLPDGDF